MSSNPPNTTNVNGNNNIIGDNNTIIQPLPDPMGHKAACQALPPPQPFIDREKERETLSKALLAGDVRLICGMGGVGKTALAQRIAQDMADAGHFPEGILWIPLEGNPAPDTVAVWILAAFGLKPEGNPLIHMAQMLNHYRPLLILDNAEAAIKTADTILDHRGKAAILVTSRDAKVGLSAIPHSPDDLDPMKDADAIDLLRSRLEQIPLDDNQAGELNTLVGGLPLALILAAGFITRTLRRDPHPMTTYLDHLRQSPLTALALDNRRELSVQVTFDLSWDRLNPTEQRAMMALAALPGESATLPALASALEMAPQSLQAVFWSLGDYSLVIQNGDRWQLHPLLKLYAGEKTSVNENSLLRERLELYYLLYALQGYLNNDYCKHLDAEHDNVLSAMTWAWKRQDWPKVISFDIAVDFYLSLRGYNTMSLERARWRWEAAKKLQNQQEIANALNNLGGAHRMLDEYELARERYTEALMIYQAINDRKGKADTLKGLGDIHYMLSEYESARERYTEVLLIYQAIDDRSGIAYILSRLGNIHLSLAEYEPARELHEEALPLFKALGERDGEAAALKDMGEIHYMLNEYESAQERYEEALLIYRSIGDRHGEANALLCIGSAHLMFNKYESAQERYEEALAIYRSIGDRHGKANALQCMGNGHLMFNKYESAQERYTEALSLYRAIGSRQGEAHALKSLGGIHYMLAEYEVARERYEEALPIYRVIGHRQGEANTLKNLGDLHFDLAEYMAARARYEEALSLYRAIEDRKKEANTLKSLGDVHFNLAEHVAARARYEEALSLYRAIEDRQSEANTLKSLGDVHFDLAEYMAARARYAEALTIYQTIDDRLGEANTLKSLGDIHLRLTEYEAAQTRYAEALPIYRAISARLGEANTLATLGRVASKQNQKIQAIQLLQASLEIFESIGLTKGFVLTVRDWLNALTTSEQE